MEEYCVNMNQQSNGDHEVHKLGCSYMPNPDNLMYLGEFISCELAIREARIYYSKVNGCYYCSNPCHTS